MLSAFRDARAKDVQEFVKTRRKGINDNGLETPNLLLISLPRFSSVDQDTIFNDDKVRVERCKQRSDRKLSKRVGGTSPILHISFFRGISLLEYAKN